MRILLDTNVLARANERTSGLARRILETVIAQHTPLVSGEMLVELARILRYPRLQKVYGLTDEEIYNYVQYLREVCEPVLPDHAETLAFCATCGIEVCTDVDLMNRLRSS